MEKKKQSPLFAIPLALIGGGIAMFITTSLTAFFVGAAIGVVLGYIITGMSDQVSNDQADGNNENE